jgi:hypothetical protein
MKPVYPRSLSRLAAVAVAAVLLAGFGACGSGSGSGTGQETGGASVLDRARQHALVVGREQCRLLGPGLVKAYHTKDPVKVARRYSKQVYIGGLPNLAIKGCLESLRAGAAGSSG